MYGNLVQLSEDRNAKTTWRRIPLVSEGGAEAIDENRLREILFRHAETLPLDEIDSAYDTPVPVCTELRMRMGKADALYLTPAGRIILAEYKLWRNPGARREVIGQILDYAGELASWSYDDLDREVRNRTRRSPFDIVSSAHNDVREQIFVDRVARHLKRGEFLLLIIGDGIREGVEDIVAYVQEYSGLRFNLALVEAAIFDCGSGDLIIQPRILARTELLPRTILVRKTILEETDDDPLQVNGESDPRGDVNERFWMAVLRGFAFSDSLSAVPRPKRDPTVWVKVEGSGHGGWGISFGAFLDRSKGNIGTYLSWRKGQPVAERVYDGIRRVLQDDMHLEDDEQREIGLTGWDEWSLQGRPRLGFRRSTEFVNGVEIRDFEEAVAWMREHFNRLVSKLHPACRRRLRTKR